MDTSRLRPSLLEHTFSWLGVGDLISGSRVSAAWHVVSSADSVWSRLLPLSHSRMIQPCEAEDSKGFFGRTRFLGWYGCLQIQERKGPSRFTFEHLDCARESASLCHLCFDGKPLYCMGANCGTLAAWFSQIAPAVSPAVVDSLASALNGEGVLMDAALDEAIAELLPQGEYAVCSFACAPGAANTKDNKCVMEMDSDGDFEDDDPDYEPIHRPDQAYYVAWCRDPSLPVNMRRMGLWDAESMPSYWRRNWPFLAQNSEAADFRHAVSVDPSIEDKFVQFDVPRKDFHVVFLSTQPRATMQEDRVAHYMALIRAGLQPTVLCISTMDCTRDHCLYTDPFAKFTGSMYLVNWIIDGHHKMEAASRLCLPVRVLTYCMHGDSKHIAPASPLNEATWSWELTSEPCTEAMEALSAGLCSHRFRPTGNGNARDRGGGRLGEAPYVVLLRNQLEVHGATYSDYAHFLMAWTFRSKDKPPVIESLDGISFAKAKACQKVVPGHWIELRIPDRDSLAAVLSSNRSLRLLPDGEFPASFVGRRFWFHVCPLRLRVQTEQ
mmetsp:Transcript_103596/g.302348  ORF Transcript_103596/g.302348 Transcript_103596/m.302348 type:complete len:551 (+) Transcript_103596:77-1729(+)